MGLFVEFDELAADDGSGGMGLGGFEGLFVADAETNHAGVLEVHSLDAREVGLLLVAEGLLGTGGGGGGDHVDEAVGVVVDEADALIARFGGDEHDDADVVAVGNGLVLFQIVLEGEVGDDDSVDAHFHAALTELLEAELHDGVEVAHQNQWKPPSCPPKGG